MTPPHPLSPHPDPPPTSSPESSPPSRSPSGRRRARAAGSGQSSATGSSAASEFFADTGPEFDPDQAPATPVVEDRDDQREDPGWEEETIREYLTIGGDVAHWALRVGEEDDETFVATQKDLDRIAPPLTRILNRYDATRAAAVAGDEGLVIAGLSSYAARNYTRRRRLIAQLRAQPDRPLTGRAAEPGTGPEHDPEWQRTHGQPGQVIEFGERESQL